uniref:Tetratricopeptide repeat protein 27-like n=1 Tax=Hirondellea gigas TaxID=1518452 RepID=A0A2P2I004_9CRUS
MASLYLENCRVYEKIFLLQNSSFDQLTDSEDELSGLVGRGSYIEALKTPASQAVFNCIGERVDNLKQHITDAVSHFLNSKHSGDNATARHTVFCIGISVLQLFVQSNFTGPVLVSTLLDLFPIMEKEDENKEVVRTSAMEYIAENTEGVYPLLRNPEYLMMAKLLLCNLLDSKLVSGFTNDWWAMRCYIILQRVADEPSSVFYESIQKCINEMEPVMKKDRELHALFYLEAGQAYLLYSDVRQAAEHFHKADAALKLKYELSGALGKRTKFQVEAKPQLVLKVQYEDQPLLAGEAEGPKLLPIDLPKDLQLNDDTRLPHYKFEEDDDRVPNLVPIEQLAILVKLQHMRRSSASDLQLQEESKAYLNALLQFPKCWAIQYISLLLRSKIESQESRAMDRSLQQLNELVDCFKRDEPSRFERLKLFYASKLPASWVIKQTYGRMLVQLGCTKSALVHFEELQLWEDVIDCYNTIQMRQRSEEIIRRLLEKEQTPKLYCLLGDATDKIEHYEKAWELSNKKSSRAQRSLGDHYFNIKDYKKASEHYQTSLDICYIQLSVWAKMGYSALEAEDWRLCSKSYRMCTVLEPDSFEYWNNLGKAHANLKDFTASLRCLKEAARLRSDCWKIFQNIVIAAVTVGKLPDAITAYRRLLALQPRHVNIPVLKKMVEVYLTNRTEENGLKLYKELSKFLSEMCNTCPSESELWHCYGAVVSTNPQPTVESRDLSYQHYRKSLSTYARGSTWYKDKDMCKNAIMKLLRVEEALMECIEGVAPESALNSFRSAFMSLNNVMLLARKGVTNVATGEVVPDCVELLKDGNASVDRIKTKIDTLAAKCSS